MGGCADACGCFLGCCGYSIGFLLVALVAVVELAVVLAAGLAVAGVVPFVLMALMTICVPLYYILRFFEFVSGLSKIGDRMAIIIMLSSVYNLLLGWDIWWIIVYTVHPLKHHVVLDLELVKWVQLFLIYSAFSIPMILPRLLGALIIRYREVHDSKDDFSRFLDGIIGIFECIVFVLAELAVMHYVPIWKHHNAFGFQTWKLIQVFVLILFGIMVINVTTLYVVDILQFTCRDDKYVVYLANGLRKSTVFVFNSIFIMAMWLCYFQPHLKETGLGSNRAMELVSWAFVCLAIASVFWFIKTFIVLLWEAHAIYSRFDKKITKAGTHFYLLAVLYDDEFQNEEKTSTSKKAEEQGTDGQLKKKQEKAKDSAEEQGTGDQLEKKQEKAKDILVQEKNSRSSLSIYELQRMTAYFQHNRIDEVLQIWRNYIATRFQTPNNGKISTVKDLKDTITKCFNNGLRDEDAKLLFEHIKDEEAQGIDTETFRNWVVKASSNCRNLGNTLGGAKEVASYLNRLLIGLFLPVVIIIWLLVTKIATIQLFILIITPLLAASFIFGDFCKNIFQGIVFAFVMHLFDVGDICIINETKMEVRRIGIWRTIFRKVDTNEQVIYQNSVLVDKVIIKQKTSLDLNDSVEYSISNTTWKRIDLSKLETEIDKFIGTSFKHDKHPLGMLVKEVGDGVKIVIHFKHRPGEHDMIYSEFHKKQNRRRADLLLKVKKTLESEVVN